MLQYLVDDIAATGKLYFHYFAARWWNNWTFFSELIRGVRVVLFQNDLLPFDWPRNWGFHFPPTSTSQKEPVQRRDGASTVCKKKCHQTYQLHFTARRIQGKLKFVFLEAMVTHSKRANFAWILAQVRQNKYWIYNFGVCACSASLARIESQFNKCMRQFQHF
jgi:hypothetical protein